MTARRTEHRLPGLRVGPMGAWLAAVGLARVLHHQADRDTSIRWEADIPVLRSAVQSLTDWLATAYHPAPVVTPWQSGGGWGAKDKEPARRIDTLRAHPSPRLAGLRKAITAADRIVAEHPDVDKDSLVRHLRNWLPDEALPWLDVAVPLVPTDGRDPAEPTTVSWAPLAGTGGNDGRWDISTNYHAALLALLGDETRAQRWASDLLCGEESEPLLQASAGPYWPGAAQAGLLNPWAQVLTVEGLLAFGEHHALEYGEAAQPWTTDTIGSGASAEPGEPGWGEAWLPMWDRPMTMYEAFLTLGGPWPRWRKRRAHTPAQMYTAAYNGGLPRGVTRVARYGLLRRRGLSHIAVPLDMVVLDRLAPLRRLGNADAAAAAGMSVSDWRARVSRRQAPPPDGHEEISGSPWWLPSTIEAFRATQPGRGTRTDR